MPRPLCELRRPKVVYPRSRIDLRPSFLAIRQLIRHPRTRQNVRRHVQPRHEGWIRNGIVRRHLYQGPRSSIDLRPSKAHAFFCCRSLKNETKRFIGWCKIEKKGDKIIFFSLKNPWLEAKLDLHRRFDEILLFQDLKKYVDFDFVTYFRAEKKVLQFGS